MKPLNFLNRQYEIMIQMMSLYNIQKKQIKKTAKIQQQMNSSLTTILSSNKIIHHLQKIQFLCQFLILSKMSQSNTSVPQLLMIIETFKFYFKAIAVARSKSIYLQSSNSNQKPLQEIYDLIDEKSTIDEEVVREQKLLKIIKKQPYLSYNYYPKMFEYMANGKKMQLITSTELPQNLMKNQLTFKHVIGEILTVLRPLISIICIRIFGIESYKSYFISLAIDLTIIIIFQRGLNICSQEEKKQMGKRKTELIMRYIFRKPFFLWLKSIIIEPLLAKFIKPERVISKLILSIIEMQSSISLTL